MMYHYTSASVVLMKLHTQENKLCLRFTDYRFLDDEFEVAEIKKFLKMTLDKCYLSLYSKRWNMILQQGVFENTNVRIKEKQIPTFWLMSVLLLCSTDLM